MDREAMVRSQRRRHVGELLEDERGREVALAERIEEVVAETEGPVFDERVLGQLDAEDAALVREVLRPPSDVDEDDTDGGADTDWADEEIARLNDEIAESRRRQLAYERYLSALDA